MWTALFENIGLISGTGNVSFFPHVGASNNLVWLNMKEIGANDTSVEVIDLLETQPTMVGESMVILLTW